MKIYGDHSKTIKWISVLVCLSFFGVTTFAEDKKTVKGPSVSKKKEETIKSESAERYVSIDFNNVDINVLIKFISELTGKNFIVDDKVKGKVTIISPGKISEGEAYKVFESVLEVHGYAAVKSGKVTKIVSLPDARTKSIETLLKVEARDSEDKIVTQLIPLRYANAADIKKLFTPLVSKSSVMLAYPQTNMLIVTDIYSNIQRLVRILSAIDVTGIGQEISVIPLHSADAAKLVKILDTVFKRAKRLKKGESDLSIKFVADERTNAIVLFASELDTFRVKKLIKLLDKKMPRGKEKIHVYYLENAVAEDLAKVLQMLPSKKAGEAKGKKALPVVSGQTKITADKATNSLIIMADRDDYLTLEAVIKKLDIPRAMVYIECLIMEVNAEKGLSLGTEWIVSNSTEIRGGDGAVGGGFSGPTGPQNILGMLTPNPAGINTYPPGAVVGVFGELISVGGLQFPSLALLIQALKTNKDVHILSTPQLITTDNQEATIMVGTNTPYLTKIGTTTANESYSNYEYKDVGITLKVTPQITKDRLVRLNIFQEVTRIDVSAIDLLGADKPKTSKRTIETTVLVHDKHTVVIGGLIDDQLLQSEHMVPCLGEIPIIGWLFKAMSESTVKTNLYFFLTPHVIQNPDEASEKYLQKKNQIDGVERDAMEAGGVKMYDWNNWKPDFFQSDSVPSEPSAPSDPSAPSEPALSEPSAPPEQLAPSE